MRFGGLRAVVAVGAVASCRRTTELNGGGACGFIQGTFTACDAFSLCINGKCASKDGKGASCDPFTSVTDPTCMPPLICDPVRRECDDSIPISCVSTDGGLDGGPG
jgi:hypothetical protein